MITKPPLVGILGIQNYVDALEFVSVQQSRFHPDRVRQRRPRDTCDERRDDHPHSHRRQEENDRQQRKISNRLSDIRLEQNQSDWQSEDYAAREKFSPGKQSGAVLAKILGQHQHDRNLHEFRRLKLAGDGQLDPTSLAVDLHSHMRD